MEKKKVIELFDGVASLAEKMGVSRHAIYMWPDVLPQTVADRVVGVCMRNNIDPTPLLISEEDAREAA